MHSQKWRLVALLAALTGAACGGSDASNPAPAAAAGGSGGAGGTASVAPKADLRVDTNRDGKVDLVDPTDDTDEDSWDAKHGAIFLANIDDDQKTCASVDAAGKRLPDDDLALCNDAADEIVNGADDELDLAPMKIAAWPEASDDATGKLSLSAAAATKVRIFKKGAAGYAVFHPESDTLSAEDLRAGVELALEGRDVVRDAATWDGAVDVKLTVTTGAGEAADTVRLRVAPVLFFHHLMPAEETFASKVGDPGSKPFRDGLRTAQEGIAAITAFNEISVDDQWMQDFFEMAYMSAPSEGGGMRVMQVYVRSANIYNAATGPYPLRDAGRLVFERFRGKDRAGLAQYDRKHDPDSDTLNSFGNLETVPPTPGFPLGRVIRGSVPGFAPDPAFQTFVASQRVQKPMFVDTSWLLVGHVDETISFVKAKTPLGWTVAVNDARLAKSMLEQARKDGHGDVPMFEGKKTYDAKDNLVSAQVTIAGVLDDTAVMAASAKAAVEVDAQLEIVKKETGATDDTFIRVPFLHEEISQGQSAAFQPGMVNGIYLADDVFASPDPHGPMIDGVDLFKAATEAAFAKHGITVRWVEDWDLYHRNIGEVHCGSNTRRKVRPTDKWWEAAQ